MHNSILKLRQTSIISKQPDFCMRSWNLWQASTEIKFNIFCWNFAHVFYLIMSGKGCLGFFLFYLDLELLIKRVKGNQVNVCKVLAKKYWTVG